MERNVTCTRKSQGWLCSKGSGIEKPIGEAVLQIDMMVGKDRKIGVRGEIPLGSAYQPELCALLLLPQYVKFSVLL